tara:strand:- start:11609 stop:12925 length:1317 start_codon:yes stop_codon:yes gene_type:complete
LKTDLAFKINFHKFQNGGKSFSFNEGIYVIFGEGGVGKTSLLKSIAGEEIVDKNFIVTEIKSSGGFYIINQNPDDQIFCSTVQGEFSFTPECYGMKPADIGKVIKKGFEIFPFKVDPKLNPSFLSGGEKEMLNLISTMQINVKTILIDDGLSFLSDENKTKIIEILSKWSKEKKKIILWATSEIQDLKFSKNKLCLELSKLSYLKQIPKVNYKTIIPKPGYLSLEGKHISFNYNRNIILDNFCLNIKNCRSLGITGENGVGKTTIAKLFSKLLKPKSGVINITINGQKVSSIGYFDQFPEKLLQYRTIDELVNKMIKNKIFDPKIFSTFKERLYQFQIIWNLIRNKRAMDISWVTLRLLILVIMTHCNYKLLVLDEPTFGLGMEQKLILRSYLNESMVSKHLIIVSHDSDFVNSICDQTLNVDSRLMNSKNNFEANGG